MFASLIRLFRRSRLRREIDEELQFHLDMRRSEFRSAGMSSYDAAEAARTRFGAIEPVRDAVHRVRHIPNQNKTGLIDAMWQDLRFGIRGFVRQPAFTGLAVLTLALGIGANTAIFGLVNSVILNPWPFENGERLAWLWQQRAGNMMISPTAGRVKSWMPTEQIETAVSLTWDEAAWHGDDGAESIGAVRTAPELFDFLGVTAVLGRSFVVGDSVLGAPNVAMLGEEFWKTRFGADRDIEGKTIQVNDETYEIVGVVPALLDRLFRRANSDVWIPLRDVADEASFSTLVRITPSASVASAEAELVAIDRRVEKRDWESDWIPHLVPPHQIASRQVRAGLWVLLGAVGLVLVIACANVANMVLARGVGRRHELAVRTALGAGKGRLARQLITESVLLSSVGAVVGVGLAYLGLASLERWLPSGLSELQNANLSPLVLLVGSAVGLISGVLFGLVPIGSRGPDRLGQDLRSGDRGGDAAAHTRLRQVLIACEVALALVLFIGAGLLLRSFAQLNAVDPGFELDRLVTMRVDLPESRYPTAAARHSFHEDVLARVRQLPAVAEATVAMGVPPRMGALFGSVEIEGRDGTFDSAAGVMSSNWVRPEYFSTLGIRVLAGRTFDIRDDPDVSVVVNDQFAREMWPGESAVGKRFRPEGREEWSIVLGVVGDVKAFGLADAENRSQIYQLFDQENFFTSGVLLVRATGNPDDIIALVRGQVQTVDSGLPVRDAMTVAAMYSESIARQRFNTISLAAFALLALILAITGVYGVITLTVNQRLREIGVRMALGAKAGDVKLWLLRWGMRPVLIGMVLGLAGALVVSRVLTSLLYQIEPTDLTTYCVAVGSMTVVGVAAIYIPARRAAAVDPIDTLRNQ